MDKSDAARLEDLEILAAHQTNTIDDLNEVIIAQGKVIADLRRKMEVLTAQVMDMEDQVRSTSPTQKPPHY